jgi:LacI family transcriptional regulator/LacI family purine nucleotide synthesis repressor
MSVVSDNITGIRELVLYCVKMGHRKIAYVHDGNDSEVTKDRVGAFRETMESLGLTVPEEYMPIAEYRKTENSRKATEKLLALKDRPTCILYPDDFSSLGGIAAIKEAGLEIPKDISIVGYDGIRVGRHLTPSLTTLRQPTELIGETAAQKLISLIENPSETKPEKIVVKGRIYEGGSVAKIQNV